MPISIAQYILGYALTIRYARTTSCAGGRHNMPPPLQVTFDVLSLKVMS